MMKLNFLLLVASLALGTAACGTPDNGPEETGPANNIVGTTGGDTAVQQPQAPAAETQGADAQRTAAELPATASPLALTGLLGVLSVAGALVVRILGRL
jgi:hypothetical protein